MKISDHIFRNFLNCPYKADLLLKMRSGHRSDYEVLQAELNNSYRSKVLASLKENGKPCGLLQQQAVTFHDLRQGKELIIDTRITHQNLFAHFDALEKTAGSSSLGRFSYLPVVFSPQRKILKEDTLLLAFYSLIIGEIQDKTPAYGKIIFGENCKAAKIPLETRHMECVRRAIDTINNFADSPPDMMLNRHCQICEFKKNCREQAVREENLSLLGQMNAKDVRRHHKKGILNITQLSCTFRSRRKRKLSGRHRKSRSFALHALAIRDRKIYVDENPVIPNAATEIFFDLEGLQDGFNYLAGLLVVKDGQTEKHSFWADTGREEETVLQKCIETINSTENYVVYHYGNYERAYLKRMQKKYPGYAADIEKILASSFNLLTVFYSNIYLPTYTNGLKEIGNFLGFRWTGKDASGIQSIVWRQRWEQSGLSDYKEKLISYNMEDCHALQMVKSLADAVINGTIKDNNLQPGQIIRLKDLKRSSPFKFLTGEFALPEFETLNKCARFDYQREKIQVRTNAYLKKYYSKKSAAKKREDYRPNTFQSFINESVCIKCNRLSQRNTKRLSKKIINLKFSASGVKRWVIQYESHLYYCRGCKRAFIPEWYKNIEVKYGHQLMGWAVCQHVVNNQSFRQIETTLHELFNLRIGKSNIHAFKAYLTAYYRETLECISRKILNSPVLYVDETPVIMKHESGYAWVFTNNEEVLSFYRPTREADFIRQYLAGYKGVLVTDFYNAYDSIDCPQQRCLLHLIRDFNDDLLKNPFDEEFKGMVQEMTRLLQEIVATVDRHGLKRRNLNKHNKSVKAFFREIRSRDYKSEIAAQYQKRLIKNQDKLFLFLSYDNVSWNNNAAEHAIKLLAIHKNRNLNFFRESRMDDYLRIMSLYQTCRYKGVSFLKFVLSGEKNIDSYCRRYMNKTVVSG